MLKYPTPLSLNYFWNFGSLLGMFLVVQILSSVFLSIHYSPFIEESFSSVVHIMENVNYGVTIRYTHVNGASFFISLIYMHLLRSLYYKRYTNTASWTVGVLLLLISMLTAFLSYVLPWGQMSYWSATVITNLLSCVPGGLYVVYWIWGGYSVDLPTLSRFFSFHFLFPFIISFLSLTHLFFVHSFSSSSPLSPSTGSMNLNFMPYFSIKDLISFMVIFFFFFMVVFFIPDLLTDHDNYIRANSMVTPAHIKPEWYYLFAYGILRCIPNKLISVMALGLSIMIFFFSPILSTHKLNQSLPRICVFFMWVFNAIFLSFLGGCEVTQVYNFYSQVCGMMYFFFFMMLHIF